MCEDIINKDEQLSPEEIERLKERYPVQQIIPDKSDDTFNVEELEDYTTELDRGEDTRERG